MKKQIIKTLTNPKGAGRKPIHDKGIRHISREIIERPSSLHITIKVRANKADIQNKKILKALHRAIMRARFKSLKVIHYTLEYNHVHLLVECASNYRLGRAMQAFGICFAKAINKAKLSKGTVYKHRYHLRKIRSAQDLKRVINYIFSNGIKHKRTKSIIDPYNSSIAEKRLTLLYPKLALKPSTFLMKLQFSLFGLLDPGKIYFKRLEMHCLMINHK